MNTNLTRKKVKADTWIGPVIEPELIGNHVQLQHQNYLNDEVGTNTTHIHQHS
jgi:hypothetical protein